MFGLVTRSIVISWCSFILLILLSLFTGNERNSEVVSFIATSDDDNTDIYIYDPVNYMRVNITANEFEEWSFAWSISGSLLYTVNETFGAIHDDLFVMNRPGNAQLIQTPDTLNSFGGVWSPDGNTLAYFSSHPRNFSDIYTISFPGATVHNLTQTDDISESNPLWSPDGEYLLYRLSGDLYLIDLSNGENRRLADLQSSPAESPVWSPDGQFVAFYILNWIDGDYVFTVPRAGGDMKELALPRTINSPVSWSPDGQQLAIIADNTDLLIYDLETDSFERIEGENRRFGPAWSPAGRWIAFLENRQLHLYDRHSGRIQTVESADRVKTPLIWRP